MSLEHARARTHTRARARTHARTHAHAHARTHTHTHTTANTWQNIMYALCHDDDDNNTIYM